MTFRLMAVTLSHFALLAYASPTCYDKNQVLPIDNPRVLDFKTSTPNETHKRGHVKGTLLQVYPHEHGHTHLQIQIGASASDTIELVYNDEFGALPDMEDVKEVEACGDYITSNEPYENYPASPDGAIIHWLHYNPNHSHHDNGFVVIADQVYGN